MADAATRFDILILGGGSGGYACALRAAELGMSVGDGRGGQGRRDLPAPRLHPDQGAAARRRGGRLGARTSDTFGIAATLEGVDLAGVNTYKDGVVARLYKGLQGLIKGRKITVIEGHGTLAAPNAIDVDGTRYEAIHVVLASGSYTKSLPGLDLDGERVIGPGRRFSSRPSRSTRSCSAAA